MGERLYPVLLELLMLLDNVAIRSGSGLKSKKGGEISADMIPACFKPYSAADHHGIEYYHILKTRQYARW